MAGPTATSLPAGSEKAPTISDRVLTGLKAVVAVCKEYLASLYAWKWVLGLTVLIGAVLIALRGIFIASIPWALKHAKIVRDFLDVLIIALDVLDLWFQVFKMMVDVALTALTFGRFKHHKFHYTPIKHVTIAELEAALTEVAVVCTPMNNAGRISRFMIKDSLNGVVCPVVRAVQPTIFSAVARETTTFAVYAPVDPGWMAQSCRPPDNTHEKWVCSALGSGFLLLEIVTPIIFLALLVKDLTAIARRLAK